MDCKTIAALKFTIRLVLKQYDVISEAEQSVLTKIKSSFEGENMQTQYSMLDYRIDSDKNIDNEMKR